MPSSTSQPHCDVEHIFRSGRRLRCQPRLGPRDEVRGAVAAGRSAHRRRSFNDNPVLAALGFAQERALPITTVVFDNGGYASMKRGVPAVRGAATGRIAGVDVVVGDEPINITTRSRR